jgi:hypothetical protein
VPRSALERVHDLLSSGAYRCQVSRITDHEIPYLWVLMVVDEYGDDDDIEIQ